MSAGNDYATLGLAPGASMADVRKRYRECAIAMHPDKCKEEGAAEAFQKVVLAYQNLAKFAR
jgi:DnaJ-class molecular chaperone